MAAQTRKEYWDERVRSVDDIEAYHLNMTEEQASVWRTLRKRELEAKRATCDFEDSLLPEPLDPKKREAMLDDVVDSLCDEPDPDYMYEYVQEMSDRDFLDVLSEEDFETLQLDREIRDHL